mgnify:CR=1 FL=1
MGSLQAKPIDNLTQEEIKELEDTFNLFDDDGSGTISEEELGQVRCQSVPFQTSNSVLLTDEQP